MRSHIVRLGAIVLIAFVLSACSDERRNPLAPTVSKDILTVYPIGFLPPRLTLQNPNDFAEIAAGTSNTCARKYNGDVYCWGTLAKTPSLMFQGARQIAVGAAHACALNSVGAAYCWGVGDHGQLGVSRYYVGSTGALPVVGPIDPTNPSGPLLPALTFNAISAAAYSTCGTTSSGVYCWGDQGMFPKVSSPGMPTPTLITNPNGYPYGGFTSLAVGASHSCGFALNQVLCWGYNYSWLHGGEVSFQTGVDTSRHFDFVNGDPRTNTVVFAAGNLLGQSVARVSTQQDFTCADMLNGTVQCFGFDYDGELGDASRTSTFVPTLIGGGMQLHGVAAGWRHACALDANNQGVCWGFDSRGQLGNGKAAGATYIGVQQVGLESIDFVNQVFGTAPITFRAIAAGGTHSCGIGTNNHIYCWGDNSSRQLGRDLTAVSGFGTFSTNPVQTM